jgi:hypothetical protein
MTTDLVSTLPVGQRFYLPVTICRLRYYMSRESGRYRDPTQCPENAAVTGVSRVEMKIDFVQSIRVQLALRHAPHASLAEYSR